MSFSIHPGDGGARFSRSFTKSIQRVNQYPNARPFKPRMTAATPKVAEVIPASIAQVDTPIAGPAGKDGVNGTNGKDGINGINGINGKDGRDGKDGSEVRIHRVLYVTKDGTGGIAGAMAAASPAIENQIVVSIGVGTFVGDISLNSPFIHLVGTGISTVIKGRILFRGNVEGINNVSNLRQEVNSNPYDARTRACVVYENCSFALNIPAADKYQARLVYFGGLVRHKNCSFHTTFEAAAGSAYAYGLFAPNPESVVGMINLQHCEFTDVLLSDRPFFQNAIETNAISNGSCSFVQSVRNSYNVKKSLPICNENIYFVKNDSTVATKFESLDDLVRVEVASGQKSNTEYFVSQAKLGSQGQIMTVGLTVLAGQSDTQLFRVAYSSPDFNKKLHFHTGTRFSIRQNPDIENDQTSQISGFSTSAGIYSGSRGAHLISINLERNVPFPIPDDVFAVNAIASSADCSIVLPNAERFTGREIRIKSSGTHKFSVKTQEGLNQLIDIHSSIEVSKYNKNEDVVTLQSDGVRWVRF